MARVIGALLLVAGFSGLGLGAAARLEGRVRDLRGMLAGLEGMRRGLVSALLPLEELLAAAAESTEGRPQGVFRRCAEELGRGRVRGFRGVWGAALEEMPLLLDREDLALLRPLGGVLGRYDGDSQAAALSRAAAQLDRQLSEALDRRHRLGKVYGTIGVSAGLFLAILLL